jgi:wyosine [tRNA(Phe)-imidazoG37] synthetase (radical SAM superfamily)
MSLQHKYVFGPVPSRRLGLSLGVDIIPSKLCTLDCIYCEVGRTDKRGLARKEYIPASEILAEVKEALHEYPNLDYITISGSGEPTLNSKIGDIIRGIKQLTTVRIAVLTNGTLLSLPEVCTDLLDADVVSPSLDAVTQEVFETVDRPHPRLRIGEIIEGLKQFRSRYRGQLWLEILFVKGVNDRDDEVRRMKEAIRLIHPDKVQINTVIRPPAEDSAQPVDEDRLKEIQAIFGERCEIIGVFKEKHKTQERNADAQAILALLRRRAMTVDGVAASLAMRKEEIVIVLHDLVRDGFAKAFTYSDEEFFQAL